MNDSATIRQDVRTYADKVVACLGNLPQDVRADLVEDLEQHLAEVAAESERPLVEQLGAPEAYAQELRRSAGLEPAEGGAARSLAAALRSASHVIARHPRVQVALDLAHELRPAWWVARAVALVLFVTALPQGLSWRPGLLWLLALAATVAVSVDVGRRARTRTDARALMALVNVAAAFALLVLTVEFMQFGFPTRYETIVEHVPPGHLAHADGEPITNIYAFDADGDALDGVFLYDGAGRPIEIGPDAGEMLGIETDYERAADGTLLRHRFPLEQYVVDVGPRGEEISRPRPRPEVDLPPLEARETEPEARVTEPSPRAAEPEAGTTEPGTSRATEEVTADTATEASQ